MTSSDGTRPTYSPSERARAARRGSGRRSLVTHALDVHERFAELLDPLSLVLTDQPHAPCERVAATAGHARVDERVEDSPLAHAQPRHHGDAELGERGAL